MNAANMDWQTVRWFRPGEWPGDVLQHMSRRVVRVLDDVRRTLPGSHAMTPSPKERAHVRHEEGISRHCTDRGTRLADATDVYMQWAHVWDAWNAALANPDVGGLGLYPDMLWAGRVGGRAMLHIDTRPERLVWVGWRENPKAPMQYIYMTSDPLAFHRIIAERAKQ